MTLKKSLLMLDKNYFIKSMFDRISRRDAGEVKIASEEQVEEFRCQVMGEMGWTKAKMELVEEILFHSGLGFAQASKLAVMHYDEIDLEVEFSRNAEFQGQPQNSYLLSNVEQYLTAELETKIHLEKLCINAKQIAAVGDAAPVGYSRYCADKYGSPRFLQQTHDALTGT